MPTTQTRTRSPIWTVSATLGHAMRGELDVAAEVNDRSSSKFTAPVTALVLIAVIIFALFMLI
jgi:hypothetical protein